MHFKLIYRAWRARPTHYLEITKETATLSIITNTRGTLTTHNAQVLRSNTLLCSERLIHQTIVLSQFIDRNLPVKHRRPFSLIISVPLLRKTTENKPPQAEHSTSLLTTQLLALLVPLGISPYTITAARLFTQPQPLSALHAAPCLLAPNQPQPLNSITTTLISSQKRLKWILGGLVLFCISFVSLRCLNSALETHTSMLRHQFKQITAQRIPSPPVSFAKILAMLHAIIPADVTLVSCTLAPLRLTLESAHLSALNTMEKHLQNLIKKTCNLRTKTTFTWNHPPLYRRQIVI